MQRSYYRAIENKVMQTSLHVIVKVPLLAGTVNIARYQKMNSREMQVS